jgi:hypothetical protein
MIWHHGGETDFDGLAVAWTPKEVEVEWTTLGVTAAATGCAQIKSDAVRATRRLVLAGSGRQSNLRESVGEWPST